MDLSQSRSSSSSLASAQEMPESETLTALACAGLLSLVIARGDTGKLLTAIATMFMLSTKLATQEIKVGLPSSVIPTRGVWIHILCLDFELHWFNVI